MLVRCGRCRVELEVSGPGEFICPACGTRNAVRGAQGAAPGGFDSGLTVPGYGGFSSPAAPSPSPAPSAPGAEEPSARWEHCPSCRYRFAIGEVERVTCPMCSTELEVTPSGLSAAGG